MAYVYKITNDINNNIYVGATVTSIADRFSKHIWEAFNTNDEYALHKAMRKYGKEHFTISIIEECSINDVFTREKYWIATLNSYINGYNETRGGEGNPKYDYELIYQKFKSGMNQKEIALELNCDKHTITRALKSFGVPEKETIKGKYGNSKKAVLKIDINTNTILKEFSSMTEAAKHENCSVASISRICNNKQNLNKNYTYIKLGDYQC